MKAPVAQDGWLIGLFAFAIRLGTIAWGANRFPPIEDGRFYHALALRISHGDGYTWQWPDGAVTFVAHYPVGYPAMLALFYRLFGYDASAGMALGAVLGAFSVVAVHRVAATVSSRKGAIFAALAVALHPALVFYTPAIMTEGIAASLIAIAAWTAVRGRAERGRFRVYAMIGLGLIFGIATLVRGQLLLLAPLFGAIAVSNEAPTSTKRLLSGAGITTAIAALVIAPWTLRNCARMDRCVVVSANLGWNLLIGSLADARGTFAPIADATVPPSCRTVFGEADKDACFTRAALQRIGEEPGTWLGLVPQKLSQTFDRCGASGWYLHAANGVAFSERASLALIVVETGYQRLLLAMALLAVALAEGPRRRLRWAVSGIAGLLLFGPIAWPSWLLFVVAVSLLGKRLLQEPPFALLAAAIGVTAITHAAFFGAGRYSLPLFAITAAAAGALFRRPFDTARKAG